MADQINKETRELIRKAQCAMADQINKETRELIRKAQLEERDKCMYHARKWIGDPDAAVNVDTYIKLGREKEESNEPL